MSRELPEEMVDQGAAEGQPPAAAAHPSPFWCRHGERWEWNADAGGYLPMIIDPDEVHPGDIAVSAPGALPEVCSPATGFDPAKYPNAGPAAVERVRAEVIAERQARGLL